VELGVGVIGTGNIGTDHVQRLSGQISGAAVRAVFDVDAQRAGAVARSVGAVAAASAQDVIDDSSVEAVIVAAPGPVHAELTLACIAAGKPVLCEKPLAPTAQQSRQVVSAEVAHGSRLVQVGFMRRYDEGYRLLKQSVDAGIGEVLLAHCVHRNASAPATFTSEMLLTDSVIHEIDTMRWLLGDELTAATVLVPKSSPVVPAGLRDPQLVLFETARGAIVDVEMFVNCQYGYDVRCEVVGSQATAALELPVTGWVARSGARRYVVAADWLVRFAGAYREELQGWVNAARSGTAAGPSAWDGYAATAVAEACVRSLASGRRMEIALDEQPALYR